MDLFVICDKTKSVAAEEGGGQKLKEISRGSKFQSRVFTGE
jgi:hypothetical protein